MKAVKVLRILAPIFTFIIPLATTFFAYAENTASSGMALSFAGILIMGLITLFGIRSIRKNIEMRHKMNRPVNAMSVFLAYKFPGFAIYGGVVWFMWTIRDGADRLCVVLSVVGIFVVIGFILSLIAQIIEDKIERKKTE